MLYLKIIIIIITSLKLKKNVLEKLALVTNKNFIIQMSPSTTKLDEQTEELLEMLNSYLYFSFHSQLGGRVGWQRLRPHGQEHGQCLWNCQLSQLPKDVSNGGHTWWQILVLPWPTAGFQSRWEGHWYVKDPFGFISSAESVLKRFNLPVF